jgi:hypothetical protein
LIVILCLAVIAASAVVNAQFVYPLRPEHLGGGPFGDGDGNGLIGRMRLLGIAESTPLGLMASSLAAYGVLYLTGALTVLVFPGNLRVVQEAFGRGGRENLRLFGIGALCALALIFLTLVGLVVWSSVLLPVPIFVPIALMLTAWIGLVGLKLALGRWLGRWAGLPQSSPLVDLAIGTLVIVALSSIPFAGRVIFLLVAMLSVGAVVATRFGTGRTWSLNEYYLPQGSNS